MRRSFTLASFLLVVALSTVRCESNTSTNPTAPTDITFSLADLAEILFARGVPVEIGDIEVFDFLPVRARHFEVSGEDVLVFEFAGEQVTEEVASTISEDGTTINGRPIDWPATPHFFTSGRVIVLYLGDNPAVIFGLADIMGPQFAGGGFLPPA